MERRLPVVENEGYDVVLSEHIADLLGWEREDILKKILGYDDAKIAQLKEKGLI